MAFVHSFIFCHFSSCLNFSRMRNYLYVSCYTEGASPGGEDEGVEGTLVRKHEWESAAKRASNRSNFYLLNCYSNLDVFFFRFLYGQIFLSGFPFFTKNMNEF